MKPFLDDDFLLTTDTARELYHDHAAPMPIYDFHCHLPPQQIAEDARFETIGEAWLAAARRSRRRWPSGRGGLGVWVPRSRAASRWAESDRAAPLEVFDADRRN